jgi:hypothetical protein
MRLAMATAETFLASLEEMIDANKKTQFSRARRIQIRFLCSDGDEKLPSEISGPLSDAGVEEPIWARSHWNIEMTYPQAMRVRDQMTRVM